MSEWLIVAGVIGVMGLLAFLAVVVVVAIYALQNAADLAVALMARLDAWVSLLGKEGER